MKTKAATVVGRGVNSLRSDPGLCELRLLLIIERKKEEEKKTKIKTTN